MLFSQRVFQNISLPLKKARLTPASRAASTLARCWPDQYSSWPTDRKRLVLEQLGAAPVGVDAGGVADVVAVGLQEADHRVLGVEQPSPRCRSPRGGERPVVADLVGAAGGRADVEAVAAVLVVRLPGRVGGLEEHVRACRRRRGRRRRCGWRRRCRRCGRAWRSRCRTPRRRAPPTTRTPPSCRSRPDRWSAAVQAVGLVLGKRRGRVDRGDLPRTVAAVVAHAVDVEPVRRWRACRP